MDLTVSVKEHTDREAIYTNHLETQTALVAATAVPAADDADAADVSGFDVAAGSIDAYSLVPCRQVGVDVHTSTPFPATSAVANGAITHITSYGWFDTG